MAGMQGCSGGANAKTLAQHDLEGTRNVTRHKGFRNPEVPEGEPEPPGELTDLTRPEWDRMLVRLRLTKTLSPLDDAALWEYVQMWSLARRLQQTVDELDELTYVKAVVVDGEMYEVGEPKVHPAVGQLRQAIMGVDKLLKNFGLTPDSRGRVRIPTDGDKKPSNPLALIQQQSAALRRVK